MKIFTNTSLAIVLFAAALSFNFGLSEKPLPTLPDNNGGEPWTVAHKKDGVIVYYDVMQCLDDHSWLCLKVVNNTGQQKKLRFTAQVVNPDNSIETFNFIKVVAPYSSEKSDCAKESHGTGLVRPLKAGSEESVVTLNFEGEAPFVAN